MYRVGVTKVSIYTYIYEELWRSLWYCGKPGSSHILSDQSTSQGCCYVDKSPEDIHASQFKPVYKYDKSLIINNRFSPMRNPVHYMTMLHIQAKKNPHISIQFLYKMALFKCKPALECLLCHKNSKIGMHF